MDDSLPVAGSYEGKFVLHDYVLEGELKRKHLHVAKLFGKHTSVV